MGVIYREIPVAANAESVWDAIRDVGAVQHRLFPGLVTDCRLEGEARIVTMAQGLVLRELIVSLDDGLRRFAYASVGGRARHHHSSLQVIPETADRCRIIWTTDVLPDELVEPIAAVIEQATPVLQCTLEQAFHQSAAAT